MKRLAIAAAAAMIVVIAGCNPFGTDELKVHLNGIIYTDSTYSLPAEGVAVLVTGAAETYLDMTDAGGVFHIEVMLYDGGSHSGSPKSTDGSTPGLVTIGIKAIDGDAYYYYGGAGTMFTVTAGDTLTMYPVDLTMFEKKTESGTGEH